MKIMGRYSQKLPQPAYIQAILTQLKRDFDLADIFYLDMWPFGPIMIILSSATAAAIPTTNSNFPQHEVVSKFFDGNVGSSFIEATSGQFWKDLHQILAPALTPTAIRMYFHNIIDHAHELYGGMNTREDAGYIENLHFKLGKYPFQVLTDVFFGNRMGEQAYKDTIHMAELVAVSNTPGGLLSPVKKWKWEKEMKQTVNRVRSEIEDRIQARYTELQQQKALSAQEKTVTILDRMLLSQMQSGKQIDGKATTIITEKCVQGLADCNA